MDQHPHYDPTAYKLQKKSVIKKSVIICYIYWLFLGLAGRHRYYAGKLNFWGCMTILFVFNFFLFIPVSLLLLLKIVFMALDGETSSWTYPYIVSGFFISLTFIIALILWFLVDAFLIPGMIRKHNTPLSDHL